MNTDLLTEDLRKKWSNSGGKSRIAMWSLDTDHNLRSLFPRQVFFPMAGEKDGWNRLKASLRANLGEDMLAQFAARFPRLSMQTSTNVLPCVPDFIGSDKLGNTFVLEIKGQKSPQNDAKHAALEEWVAAIGGDSRFLNRSWAVAYRPVEVHDIVAKP